MLDVPAFSSAVLIFKQEYTHKSCHTDEKPHDSATIRRFGKSFVTPL